MSKGGDKQTIGYKYYMGLHLVLCAGKVDRFQLVRIGEKVVAGSMYTSTVANGYGYTSINDYLNYHEPESSLFNPRAINTDQVTTTGLKGSSVFDIGCVMTYDKPELFGGDLGEGGVSGALVTFGGDPNQEPMSYFEYYIDDDYPIPAYRGVTSVLMPQNYIGNSPYIKAIDFIISRIFRKLDYSPQWYPQKACIGGYDMNPAHIILEFLTDKEWGCGESIGDIDYSAFASAADRLYEEGLGLSFLVNDEAKVEDFVSEVLSHINGVLRVNRTTADYELKLLRNDFKIEDIPHFNKDNILRIKDYTRPSISELPNVIIVTYWDLALKENSTYKAYDPAAIAIQGGEVIKEVTLTGVTNLTLAAKLAHRMLFEQSTPLASMTIEADRSGYGMNVGDPITVTWDEFNLDHTTFRIIEAKEEDFGKGQVSLKVVEDIFKFAEPEIFVNVRDPDVVEGSVPKAVEAYDVIELPYALTLQVISAGILEGADLEYHGFLATVAVKNQATSFGYIPTYKTMSPVSGELFSYTPSLVLTQDLGVSNTEFSAAYYEYEISASQTEFLASGSVYEGLGYINGEFVWLTYDTNTNKGTLSRGGFDGTPTRHLAGDRIYIVGTDTVGFINHAFVEGENVNVWFSTFNEDEILPQVLSPKKSLKVNARQFLPNPPRNIQFDRSIFNERAYFNYDGSVLNWVASDKLTENHQFLSWFETVGTKDENAVYSVSLHNSSNSLIYYDKSLTLETVQLPILVKGEEYTLKIKTILDDIESLTYESVFKVKPNHPPLLNIKNAESRFYKVSPLGTIHNANTTYFDETKASRSIYLATVADVQLAGYTPLDTNSLWGEVLIFEFSGHDITKNIAPEKVVLVTPSNDTLMGFGIIDGEPCVEFFLGSPFSQRVMSGVILTEGSHFKFIFDPYYKFVRFYSDENLISEVNVESTLHTFAHRVGYGEEINRINYYTGDDSNANMHISEIKLTTYAESIPVDASNELLINGYAEAGMAAWEVNPEMPYVTASTGYSVVDPSEGNYMFVFGREDNNYTDIWFRQHVNENRIFGKYGFSLSKLQTLDTFDIKIAWKQARHSSRDYGVYLIVEQYDSAGVLLNTETSTNFVNTEIAVMESFEFRSALVAGAETFRVTMYGVYSHIYMYLGVDEIVATIETSTGEAPPAPEDISALNVSSYGTFSFHQAPESSIASYGAFSFHQSPEIYTGVFGAVSFFEEIIQDTQMAAYGAVSFHTIMPSGRNISGYGAVSFHQAPDTDLAAYGAVTFMTPPELHASNYGAVSFFSTTESSLATFGAVSFLTEVPTQISTLNAVTFLRPQKPTFSTLNAVTFMRPQKPTFSTLNVVTFMKSPTEE